MKIIIFHEKHGDRYFDASTDEARNAACFKILKERFEEGWYEEAGEKPSDEDILSDEQIEKLPTGTLRQIAHKDKKLFEGKLKQWKKESEFFTRVNACIDGKNLPEAYKLICFRDGGEYETFDEEELEELT